MYSSTDGMAVQNGCFLVTKNRHNRLTGGMTYVVTSVAWPYFERIYLLLQDNLITSKPGYDDL